MVAATRRKASTKRTDQPDQHHEPLEAPQDQQHSPATPPEPEVEQRPPPIQRQTRPNAIAQPHPPHPQQQPHYSNPALYNPYAPVPPPTAGLNYNPYLPPRRPLHPHQHPAAYPHPPPPSPHPGAPIPHRRSYYPQSAFGNPNAVPYAPTYPPPQPRAYDADHDPVPITHPQPLPRPNGSVPPPPPRQQVGSSSSAAPTNKPNRKPRLPSRFYKPGNLNSLADSREGPNGRPPYPYSTIVRYAIEGAPKGMLTLAEIYEVIEARFPYYRNAGMGWKNSIRHTLSSSSIFEKKPRAHPHSGKGGYWKIKPHGKAAHKPGREAARKPGRESDPESSAESDPESGGEAGPPGVRERKYGGQLVDLSCLVRKQGDGAYALSGCSDIWRGEMTDTGQSIAIKVLRVTSPSTLTPIMSNRVKKRFNRELSIWMECQHQRVLKLLGYAYIEGFPCLISPWCQNGNIMEYLKKNPFENRLLLVIQVAEGLVYLHGRDPPVIHSDVKPANVLINESGDAKICDFGISKLMMDTPSGFTTTKGVSFTLRYSSKELLCGDKNSMMSDVFAFGMLVLEVMTNKYPFCRISLEAMVVVAVTNGETPSPQDYTELPASDPLWNIMKECWDAQPTKRPTMVEVLDKLRECV